MPWIQRFEVLAELGKGGMGTVYRARDPQLEREVAIKVLRQAGEPIKDALATRQTIELGGASPDGPDLLHEARVMAKLAHPNVVPVYEVGLHGRDVFVVMELVTGSDLRAWLKTARPKPEITAALAQAARGLAAAHERGIIHRDFKPENVLIGLDGRARVADFGIAKLGTVRGDDTAGTPRYMAPELWAGGEASPKSDVFSLCRVIEEALGLKVATGLDSDPAKRPDAIDIAVALERRGGRPWLVAGVAAVAIAGGVAFAMFGSSHKPSCVDDDPIAGWETGPPAERAQSHAIQSAKHALCLDDPHDGGVRASCLDRRELELRARLRALLAGDDRLDLLAPAERCATIDAPPIRDPIAVAALFDRYAVAATPDDYVAIEKEAVTAGERELASWAARDLGAMLIERDAFADADAALERAQSRAHEIRDDDGEALALVDRSSAASRAGDVVRSDSYAKLALQLADKAAVDTRAQVHGQLGRVLHYTNKNEQAVVELNEALEIATSSTTKIRVQTDLIYTLDDLKRPAEAIKVANQTLALVRTTVGDTSVKYAKTLDARAYAYEGNDQLDAAITDSKAALDLLLAKLGPTSSAVTIARGQLARLYQHTGKLDLALDMLALAVAATETDPTQHWRYPDYAPGHAAVSFALGHYDDAIAEMRRLLDDPGILNNALLFSFRFQLANELIEVGRLDEAAGVIDQMKVGHASDADLAVLTAELAIDRGHPHDGEVMVRDALAQGPSQWLSWLLAQSLIAQGKFADARAPLAESRRTRNSPPQNYLDDLLEAQIDLGLGDRGAALKLARAIHVEPSQPRAQRMLDKLLK